jgi:hypothetical protein
MAGVGDNLAHMFSTPFLRFMAVAAFLGAFVFAAASIVGKAAQTYRRDAGATLQDADPATCPGEKPICRQVVGIDPLISNMTDEDVSVELNDAWARDVLRVGHYPVEISAILATMQEISQKNGYSRRTFLVAEGGKLRAPPPDFPKDFRFVTHWSSDDQPNLFLGTPPSGNRSTFLEVIAWDAEKGAFNYYERQQVGQRHVWIWRGDTRHAFDQRSKGQSCFACHVAGTLIMKELDRPWNNWNSEVTGIDSFPSDFGSVSTVQANSLERLIRRGIGLTAPRRVAAANGSLLELLSPLLETRAANLVSSEVRSDFVGTADESMPLPVEFFLNAKAFGQLGLTVGSMQVGIPRAQYLAAIGRFGFRLSLGNSNSSFEQPGDTFFGMLTPAMAAEDIVHLRSLLEGNLVAPEMAAALLMVDFPNPVFSSKRASLARHLSGLTAESTAGVSLARLISIVEQAAAIQPVCDASNLDACSGEQQFLHFAKIAQTDAWRDTFSNALREYTAAVAQRLSNDANVGDDYVCLVAWRRQLFGDFPSGIAESRLLFPKLQQALSPRSMTMRGNVIITPQ